LVCLNVCVCAVAAAGRGMCKIAVDVPSIKPSMEELLQAAGLPVRTDIQLQGLPGGKQYPRPIPDLCVGQPLVVTGCVPRGGLRPGQAVLEGQNTTGGGEGVLGCGGVVFLGDSDDELGCPSNHTMLGRCIQQST
jgi:hypothetical protein